MEPGNRQQDAREAFDASAFVRRVGEFADSASLIPPQACVLVGVSGGADSVALLTILHELAASDGRDWRLAVAHLNHCLRDSADADEQFVRELAEKLGLECHVDRRDIATEAKETGKTVEEAGRDARLDFFARAADENGYTCVALGHHADDNVETVLHRIFRGTHLRGLGGIAASRQLSRSAELIRPLLQCRRSEIEQFCKARALEWREDETNTDTKYSRNFIRHELLPLLRDKLNPRVDEAISRLALFASQADQFLRSRAMELLIDEQNHGPDYTGFNTALLTDEPEILQRCVLKLVVEDQGVPLKAMTYDHYQQLAAICRPDGPTSMQLPGGFEAFVENGMLMIALRGSCGEVEDSPVELNANSTALCAGGEIHCDSATFDADQFAEHCTNRPGGVELIDADKVTLPLTVRHRRDGDRFNPLGLGGTQSVSDFLTNSKLTRADRESVRCICDSKGIVYLAPLRIDERVKVTDKTKRILRIDASDLVV